VRGVQGAVGTRWSCEHDAEDGERNAQVDEPMMANVVTSIVKRIQRKGIGNKAKKAKHTDLIEEMEGLASRVEVLLLAESRPHNGQERREAKVAVSSNVVYGLL
jgi:hypothetical protein